MVTVPCVAGSQRSRTNRSDTRMAEIIEALPLLAFMLSDREKVTYYDINMLQEELDEEFKGDVYLDASLLADVALCKPHMFIVNPDFSISKAEKSEVLFTDKYLNMTFIHKLPVKNRKRIIEMLKGKK